jgi:hypothetical protein
MTAPAGPAAPFNPLADFTFNGERSMSPLGVSRVGRFAGLALLAMLAAGAGPASAPQPSAETVRLVLRQGSRLWLEGDSNLHAWSCDAKSVIPELRLQRPTPNDPPASVEEARLLVAVANIECGNGKMNENLRKALRAEDHENISFVVTGAEFIDTGSRGELEVLAKGTLTVAGTSRDLQFQVSGTDTGTGALRLTGRIQILMTQYGVQPPTAMLGLLKTRNEVLIRFDLVADYEKIEAAVSSPVRQTAAAPKG